MAKIKGWTKVVNQPKSKQWIDAEYYSNKKEILIYKDKIITRWIVYIGNYNETFMKYMYFDTKKEALDYATKYMRSHPNG